MEKLYITMYYAKEIVRFLWAMRLPMNQFNRIGRFEDLLKNTVTLVKQRTVSIALPFWIWEEEYILFKCF